MRPAVSIVLIAVVAACATRPSQVVEFSVSEDRARVAQAESLVDRGHYTAFKRAVKIYGELYGRSSLRPKIAAPYAEACLLLGLREKEIGIDNPATVAMVGRLLRENPSLTGMDPYVFIISTLAPRTAGVMGDINLTFKPMAKPEAWKAAVEVVRKQAARSDFAAYVLAALTCSSRAYLEQEGDPAESLKAFPGSILLKYEAAICGPGRPELLEEILAADPEFAEAHYHLGEAALKQKRLVTAETHLLKAFEAIPESPQPRVLLAGIYFATEEFDKSLEFYNLTLDISPGYRDALLGKAICLSSLGRHDEAIAVLNRIIDLGSWLLGEGHYWLAWNLHGLKRDDEALKHIDESKGRLPTSSEVFSLGGTVALELNEPDRAERDFLESLKYDGANTESLFGLGTINSKKGRWGEAGAFFESAGKVSSSGEAALLARIAEIRQSALAEDRKARLVRRREAQLDRLRLTGATAWYDAAAAYLNAGLKDQAAEAAAKAVLHPALKEKTEELLRSIKK